MCLVVGKGLPTLCWPSQDSRRGWRCGEVETADGRTVRLETGGHVYGLARCSTGQGSEFGLVRGKKTQSEENEEMLHDDSTRISTFRNSASFTSVSSWSSLSTNDANQRLFQSALQQVSFPAPSQPANLPAYLPCFPWHRALIPRNLFNTPFQPAARAQPSGVQSASPQYRPAPLASPRKEHQASTNDAAPPRTA